MYIYISTKKGQKVVLKKVVMVSLDQMETSLHIEAN